MAPTNWKKIRGNNPQFDIGDLVQIFLNGNAELNTQTTTVPTYYLPDKMDTTSSKKIFLTGYVVEIYPNGLGISVGWDMEKKRIAEFGPIPGIRIDHPAICAYRKLENEYDL